MTTKHSLLQANVPNALFRKVVSAAKKRGISQADVVREALLAHFSGAPKPVSVVRRLEILEDRVFADDNLVLNPDMCTETAIDPDEAEVAAGIRARIHARREKAAGR